jgi:hypothetical protein
MDFPSANTIVTDFLEWFWTEVQALPISFSECNENITCFTLIGVLKILVGVECGHLPELESRRCLAMTRSFTMSLMMLVELQRDL